jgi:hypothetical protein
MRRALYVIALLAIGTPALAEEQPMTRDVPIQEFQNKHEQRSYDFNSAPEGIFRSIEFAESFEEELGFRRTHEIVPVGTTSTFRSDAPAVFVVFRLYQHLDSFQVFGVCFPDQVEGVKPGETVAQDAMYIALEDDSGYLRLQAPKGGWKPGRYKVEIHIGWQINEISLVGTMRFDVKAG